ncbi:immunoglobulin I-set domain protein [Streptomyces phyllanthi]|uniref:Immunoglobulin I-set domain protein n=1 Tax=Streptomyces phyllanthi TaxID=1803180 RepID=A0A5N8VU51_9ACTN|nr:immunoglobulin I-set domain protein [Streptomyces phyllanthi]MPY38783.1 immunoglobulin I-set domain protein [Streptomyces phyllanthi]
MAVDRAVRRRPGRAATPRTGPRRPAALLGAAALVLTAVAVGPSARAADTPKTAFGKDGQKLTVSASANLDPDGETLRVTGEGYDATKGIYVALCKDNGDNRIPTPCLGGADQTGSGSASKWIVPKGDPNEGDLATPYGDGGTFDVELAVKAQDGGLDCTEVTCSVVTRVDHRAAGDRSQDVRIPVTFEGQDPGDGDDGGDGVEVPPGTVSYVRSADFRDSGKPLDVLVHPGSGKLYVGADNIADTADVNEQGLYVLDAGDGKVRSHVSQAPGSNGTLGGRRIPQVIAPLSGDGVVFHYPVRGIGTAKDGDTVAKGVWLAGGTVTASGPGTDASTVLVQQGAALSEIETATGAVKRTLTLDGGARLGVDTAHKAAWSGYAGGKLSRVDTGSFTVTASAGLPAGHLWFIAPDPATGNVWVGSENSVLVYDRDAKPVKTITGQDRAADIAFDTATGRAFVVWQDSGDTGDGGDNNGSLAVYDTRTYEPAAEPVKLSGNQGQNGQASIAVTPGGTAVYVASPAEGKVTKLDRRMSPKITQAPTDQTVAPGDKVTFVAAAEGAPEPTVRWQASPDGGQTWSTIEGATKNAYSFTAKAAHDGYEYRAAFTNTSGTTRTTPVTLTVTESGDDGGDGGGDGDGDEDTEPSGTKTVTGPEGQKLTVTPVNHLATKDQTLKIKGSGYDEDKGVYVALCVDNGDGELPTPCIGGVDMTGTSHSSAWISSDPPDYGEDLAIPYGDGGTFEVELTIDAKDEFTDCFKVTCVLATRADHTLSGDRSQDVKVPVSFVGQAPVDTDDGDGGTGGGDSGGTTGGSGSTPGSGGTSGTTVTGGGSLASTGVTVLTLATVAALLTAAGWFAYRRGRAGGTGSA